MHWNILPHKALPSDRHAATRCTTRPSTPTWCSPRPRPTPVWMSPTCVRLAAICRSEGARLVVDNTTATPLGQLPLSLGADLVVASATKALSGHSDLLAGYAAGKDPDLMAAMTRERLLSGPILGAFESWLLLRSLGSAGLRFERQCQNAQALAEVLRTHPAVRSVRYPGLADDPGHPVAAGQMRRFGGLVSVELADAAAVIDLVRRSELLVAATSFGGIHTSVDRRARWGDQVSDGFVRISLGIEDTDDIVADIEGPALIPIASLLTAAYRGGSSPRRIPDCLAPHRSYRGGSSPRRIPDCLAPHRLGSRRIVDSADTRLPRSAPLVPRRIVLGAGTVPSLGCDCPHPCRRRLGGGRSLNTRFRVFRPAASCAISIRTAFEVVPVGITPGRGVGARRRRPESSGDCRRPAARGDRRVGDGAGAAGRPRPPRTAGVARRRGRRRGAGRRRRGVPGAARPVRRGRHHPGPARTGRACPTSGAGVLASAAGMDKEFTKKLLVAEGLPVGDHVVLRAGHATVEAEDRAAAGAAGFRETGPRRVVDRRQSGDGLG